MQYFKNPDQWSLHTSELNQQIERLENELNKSAVENISLRKKLQRSKSKNKKIETENEKLQHAIQLLTIELDIANSVKRNLKDMLDGENTVG